MAETYSEYLSRIAPADYIRKSIAKSCPAPKLQSLAGFGPKFRRPDSTFGRWIDGSGRGTRDDPHREGYWESSPLFDEYFAMVHAEGWVWPVTGFTEFMETADYKRLSEDHSQISQANANQLRLLITIIVARERWVDGSVGLSFEDGTLLAIAERAEVLLQKEPGKDLRDSS